MVIERNYTNVSVTMIIIFPEIFVEFIALLKSKQFCNQMIVTPACKQVNSALWSHLVLFEYIYPVSLC